YIPPFSLWWIGMIHDYWRYADDPEFVRDMLPGVRAVLTWFAGHQLENGSLGPLPWWNYVDWVPGWRSGVPPGASEGSSAPIDLQLLLALDWAAELEAEFGRADLSDHHRRNAARLRETIKRIYWDPERRLFRIRSIIGISPSTRTRSPSLPASSAAKRRAASWSAWRASRRWPGHRFTSVTMSTSRIEPPASEARTSIAWIRGEGCWRRD